MGLRSSSYQWLIILCLWADSESSGTSEISATVEIMIADLITIAIRYTSNKNIKKRKDPPKGYGRYSYALTTLPPYRK
jgi:hypothetical protein